MNDPMLKPQDGEWFAVIPAGLDINLFLKKRDDVMQEQTRKIIEEALNTIKQSNGFYTRPFKTLRLRKRWSCITEINLIEIAHRNGDYLETWIEQAMEWAQRIQNGESWESVCNERIA